MEAKSSVSSGSDTSTSIYSLCVTYAQLASDSENEGEPGTEAEPSPFSSKTLLIAHPARKCVFEFLRVIMTDALTSPTSAKSLGVIDTILEVRKSIIFKVVLFFACWIFIAHFTGIYLVWLEGIVFFFS